ncbi:MAG TPA: DUF1460 domain-containing protein [Syntrophales bacterium]|nr:DUF1460 domain-containing protein [Syntrophales bacterium]
MQQKGSPRREFARLVKEILSRGERSPGALVAAAARALLGRPYRAAPLERGGAERLVVDFTSFDCVTLVETAVALALTASSPRPDFDRFAARLRKIRYRKGRLAGYASRLHYFSDWLADNEAKMILHDRTRGLGGVACRRKIDRMSAHRERYPALKDPAAFRSIRAVERRLSARSWYCLEKRQLRRAEKAIREGDIVAIASGEEGLDVCHVGIAVRHRGRVRLLHASSAAGCVIASDETLYSYLQAKKHRAGVLVAGVVGEKARHSLR